VSVFTSHIAIRFADIDMLGHVNNANYITYIEQARIDFFNHHIPNFDWSNAGIILARTEIDYHKPLYLKDQLYATVECTKTGTKSFDLSYALFTSNSNKKIAIAKAKTTMVCYNYQTKKTIAIPEEWKYFLSTKNNITP